MKLQLSFVPSVLLVLPKPLLEVPRSLLHTYGGVVIESCFGTFASAELVSYLERLTWTSRFLFVSQYFRAEIDFGMILARSLCFKMKVSFKKESSYVNLFLQLSIIRSNYAQFSTFIQNAAECRFCINE